MQLKIAYISSSQIPSHTANSIHVMKMCHAFAENGHDVILFVREICKKFTKEKDIFSYYGVSPKFKILERPYRKLKYKYEVYTTGIWAAWKSKRMKADLVYCRNITGCLFSAFFGLPVIFESHSPVSYGGKFQEYLFRRLIRTTGLKKIIVITHALKRYYENNYPEIVDKIIVAPDAADPISTNDELGNKVKFSKSNRTQIGYIGHLYKGRGIELIINLAKNIPDADFHLVGGTTKDIGYWKKLTKTVDNLFFHGFLPPSEADKYKVSFDILLAPYQAKVIVSDNKSDTSKWMSPLKVFEYMSSRKPIVCSNLPVLREVLEHERNALLCSPCNLAEWKNAIERLMCDNELSQRISESAYSDFINNYTWEKRAEKTIDSLN